MKIVLALDSFKGCLTSTEVEQTLAEALADKGIDTLQLPMSDGGEGMLDAFIAALKGKLTITTVHDPLMRNIPARYGITDDGTAVIETASACGLTLMKETERDPLKATTFGVGELIADAIENGCRKFIIGLGGSGTSDAGKGMLQALAERFAAGGIIENLPESLLKTCVFTLACDVRNPLCGPEGAAHTFAPQKGATPAMVAELEKRARLFAEESARTLGRDASQKPGAGAAGGLGYAFMQYLSAGVASGADLLLDLIGFDRVIKDADLIITGEGRADKQTLMGKLPERILKRARQQQLPVWLIAGQASEQQQLEAAGFAHVASLTPPEMELDEALRPETAKANIRNWVERTFSDVPQAGSDIRQL